MSGSSASTWAADDLPKLQAHWRQTWVVWPPGRGTIRSEEIALTWEGPTRRHRVAPAVASLRLRREGYFYRYTPPRPLEEIEADIRGIEQDVLKMLAEVTGGNEARDAGKC